MKGNPKKTHPKENETLVNNDLIGLRPNLVQVHATTSSMQQENLNERKSKRKRKVIETSESSSDESVDTINTSKKKARWTNEEQEKVLFHFSGRIFSLLVK